MSLNSSKAVCDPTRVDVSIPKTVAGLAEGGYTFHYADRFNTLDTCIRFQGRPRRVVWP